MIPLPTPFYFGTGRVMKIKWVNYKKKNRSCVGLWRTSSLGLLLSFLFLFILPLGQCLEFGNCRTGFLHPGRCRRPLDVYGSIGFLGHAADSVQAWCGHSVELSHGKSAGEATLVQHQRRNSYLCGLSPETGKDGYWVQQGFHLFGKQLY